MLRNTVAFQFFKYAYFVIIRLKNNSVNINNMLVFHCIIVLYFISFNLIYFILFRKGVTVLFSHNLPGSYSYPTRLTGEKKEEVTLTNTQIDTHLNLHGTTKRFINAYHYVPCDVGHGRNDNH